MKPYVLTTIKTRQRVFSVDTKEALAYQRRDIRMLSAEYNGKPGFAISLTDCPEAMLTPGRYVRVTLEVLRTDEEVRDVPVVASDESD